MSRSWVRAVAVAGAVTVLAGSGLAGCGIPTGTGVRVDGPLPEAGLAQISSNTAPTTGSGPGGRTGPAGRLLPAGGRR